MSQTLTPTLTLTTPRCCPCSHMNLALVLTAWLAAAAIGWSWTLGSFRCARVWSKNKRNLASFKNKFGYKDKREKRSVMKHPMMFNRDSRFDHQLCLVQVPLYLCHQLCLGQVLCSLLLHFILISAAPRSSITMSERRGVGRAAAGQWRPSGGCRTA